MSKNFIKEDEEKKAGKFDVGQKAEKFVVNIKKVEDNKKYSDSVTKFISKKQAKEIYKILKMED